jgi:preprotein translocase subunit SecD
MPAHYPKWKYLLLVFILAVGVLYSLPNLYGDDPAVQVETPDHVAKDETFFMYLQEQLKNAEIPFKRVALEKDDVLVRFDTIDDQLKAKELLQQVLGDDYSVALNLAPATPKWLQAIGAEPLKLGLDLRGGVHFLMEVDIDTTLERRYESFLNDFKAELREAKLRYSNLKTEGNGLVLRFATGELREAAYQLLKKNHPDVEFTRAEDRDNVFDLMARLSPQVLQTLRNDTMEQTVSILRNRVNELGVAEALVQRQGLNRIVVELPGIQDTAYAKDILGKTATLEFVMQDDTHDVRQALAGKVPPGSRLLSTRDDRQVLVKKQVLLSGDSITGARASFDGRDGRPSVDIRVTGSGLGLFTKATRDNIGKQMAVVYIETKTRYADAEDGASVNKTIEKEEKIISLATIQSALGSHFQITGLNYQEAQDLALLLRAGALPAAVSVAEERTVGPSLGQENIRLGMLSVELGMGLVLIFMLFYYSVFGLIANIALLMNLVLLLAALSLIGATLTLPGIAGIVLTVGMAVDANVLIFERIREELRNGMSPKASIHSGFERALATIIDSNLTTLIVGVILFSVGTGPIRGFAVTLSIGILTSMLTAITGTRAIVQLIFGSQQIKRLPVGI